MAVTPLRNFRCDDELWDQALATAAARRESISDVLRRALLEYVAREQPRDA